MEKEYDGCVEIQALNENAIPTKSSQDLLV